jgi:hypothetical protein
MRFASITALLLATVGIQFALAQTPPDPWKALPGTTAYDLKTTFRAELVSSDALSWADGRSVLITYWRGGPSDTYYRCADFKGADFQSTGHSCWELVGR